MKELRELMTNDLQRVSEGDITPAVANACSNLCGKIISSVKLEVDYNRMTGSNSEIGFLKGL
jgi:hypothetical protein